MWPARSCFNLCFQTREKPNFHLEFCLRDVTDGRRSPWKLPVGGLEEIFLEVITVAKKIESTTQPVIWLGFHSSAIEDVRYDALWLALLDEVRQLEANAPNRLVTDCDGFIER